MSNAKRIKVEKFEHEGDYRFTVPHNVTSLCTRFYEGKSYRYAAGSNHSFVIGADGLLYGWGGNSEGQQGDQANANLIAPTPLFGVTRFKNVISGANITMALSEKGVCYVWGIARGDGTTGKTSTPVIVTGFSQLSVVDIFPSNDSAFIKDEIGQVWAIGSNASGRLGTGSVVFASSPVLIAGGLRWKRVEGAKNGLYSMGLAENGNLYSWGSNIKGQHGNGTVTTTSSPVLTVTSAVTSVRDFATGDGHSSFIFNANGIEGFSVYTCGNNSHGQLGDGTVVAKSIPVMVQGLPTGKRWKQVACGSQYSLALSEDGDLYGWGSNTLGQLSGAPSSAVSTPVLLNNKNSFPVKIREVSAGESFVLAVDYNGKMYSWGDDTFGQLGNYNASSVGITSPNFYILSPPGQYKVRSPYLAHRNEEVMEVTPGEVLTVQVRQGHVLIKGSDSKIKIQRTDMQAVHVEYWGD